MSKSAVRTLAGLGAGAYLIVTSTYLLLHGSWPTPDFIIPPLLLFAVIVGRGWSFVIDWSSFLLLLIVYQSFAGVADDLNSRVHFVSLIEADRWLLRTDIPISVLLQDRFFRDDQVTWYDWVSTFLHAAHFVAPSILGFFIWIRSRGTYWRYLITTICMFYAAFITYIIYPAAPPWLAAQQELIPPVTRVLIHTLASIPSTEPLALLYQNFSPNDVAALPSLHSAAPMLVALVTMAIWRWRAVPILLYPLAGGIAWMYLGEHYLIDVLFGWLYALAAFVFVWFILTRVFRSLRPARAAAEVTATETRRTRIPSWPLGALAVALALYVWVDPIVELPLHPSRGAIIPDTGIRAGQAEPSQLANLDPQNCNFGASSSSYIDQLLGPVAHDYGAYLLGIDEDSCFALSAVASIPALDQSEIQKIDTGRANQAPQRLRLVDEPPRYLTMVQTGTLADSGDLPEGLVPGQRYALVIRMDNTEGREKAQELLVQLSRLAFEPPSS